MLIYCLHTQNVAPRFYKRFVYWTFTYLHLMSELHLKLEYMLTITPQNIDRTCVYFGGKLVKLPV